MNKNLQNAWALVTGASSGIGRVYALSWQKRHEYNRRC